VRGRDSPKSLRGISAVEVSRTLAKGGAARRAETKSPPLTLRKRFKEALGYLSEGDLPHRKKHTIIWGGWAHRHDPNLAWPDLGRKNTYRKKTRDDPRPTDEGELVPSRRASGERTGKEW